MNRNEATQFARSKLDELGLKDWGIRLSTNERDPFLGFCIYKDKCIVLNAFHIDIHPDAEIRDTILHEIAHAIVGPGHGHGEAWIECARNIGCTNTLPCSHLDLPSHVIDGIRSNAEIEMTVVEETHVVRRPTYRVQRIQDKCEVCGKIAKEKYRIKTHDKQGNEVIFITLECFHVIRKNIPRGTAFETFISNAWKDDIKACKHVWDKNTCLECGEFRLFNFQIEGARKLESSLAERRGFGIFDDMGLGKTVQALAYIHFHPDIALPVLIVTKSAIKFQWFKEVYRWLGPAFASQIITTSKDYIFPNLKSYIIPYDLLRRMPSEELGKVKFKCVILDECQQIKNPDSARTQAVRKLLKDNSIKVIPLSGTPWKNRGGEFFPVLNMMDPIRFYSYQNYLDNWVDFYWEGNKRKMGGIVRPDKFREYTQDILIRREYNEVMEEFPEVKRMKLSVELDSLTQTTYDQSVSEFVEWYNEFVMSGEEDAVSGIQILSKLARMRHITGLAKIPATLSFVEEFIEDTVDRKLVIFVHHQDVGQLLYDALRDETTELGKSLKDNGVVPLRYTSDLDDAQRHMVQEEFNRSPRSIMIASTLACGEGVNLQTCADCVMHERQWNPQNEDQAAPGRFRRIGQISKVINITFPEASGTVDEHLDDLVSKKRRQFHEVMNRGEMPQWNEGNIGKELAEIIMAKHREKNKGKAPTKITSKAKLQPVPSMDYGD